MKRIGAILLAIEVFGCSAGSRSTVPATQPTPSTVAPAPVSSSPSAQPTATSTPRTSPKVSMSPTSSPSMTVPVDPSIEPVSFSKPSAEAAEALRLCQVDLHGVEKVTGMGRIDHARDAFHYASFTGREPELMTEDPAWMITFGGELPMPKINQMWIDPTCVVVDHDGGIFGTGARSVSGKVVPPPPDTSTPDRALPPLLP